MDERDFEIQTVTETNVRVGGNDSAANARKLEYFSIDGTDTLA